jgi:hypothetical protein
MQENKHPIKQWAKDDRPREKLLSKGAENLRIPNCGERLTWKKRKLPLIW